jgi:hypothetical protein
MTVELRCNSASITNRKYTSGVTVELEQVELDDVLEAVVKETLDDRQTESLLDKIGSEYIKRYFDLDDIDEDAKQDQKILQALRAAGVDNWEGYDDAIGGVE